MRQMHALDLGFGVLLSQQKGIPAGVFSGSVSFSRHSGQLPLQPTHLHHDSSYDAVVHEDTS